MKNSHCNHNYRIGTDTLVDGRVKAKAHGRKTNAQTFPAGTTHEKAAIVLARKIEGERFSHVMLHSGAEGYKADWAVYVSFDSIDADARLRAELAADDALNDPRNN